MKNMCLTTCRVSSNATFIAGIIQACFNVLLNCYTCLSELQTSLSQKMFGQPLVGELMNILAAHKEAVHDKSKSNKKALVISLHGWSGVGKNYASTMIAEAIYTNGMQSKFVKLFMGKKDFDCTDLEKSKVSLYNNVLHTICLIKKYIIYILSI